jgi:DNA invertase Pin-like site-specific DNA recombinase
LFPSCLRCPLPRCVEEVARERQRLRMSARAKRMAELKTSGHTVNGIARLFGVSTRTVQRALAKSKAKNKKAKVQVKSEK